MQRHSNAAMETLKLTEGLRVGDLARITGRCAGAIRYWSARLGIKARRTAAGYREFSAEEAASIVQAIAESAKRRPFARPLAEDHRNAPPR
jgi:hypothetical protein